MVDWKRVGRVSRKAVRTPVRAVVDNVGTAAINVADAVGRRSIQYVSPTAAATYSAKLAAAKGKIQNGNTKTSMVVDGVAAAGALGVVAYVVGPENIPVVREAVQFYAPYVSNVVEFANSHRLLVGGAVVNAATVVYAGAVAYVHRRQARAAAAAHAAAVAAAAAAGNPAPAAPAATPVYSGKNMAILGAGALVGLAAIVTSVFPFGPSQPWGNRAYVPPPVVESVDDKQNKQLDDLTGRIDELLGKLNATPTATSTPQPTATPYATATPVPTATSTAVPTAVPTATSTPFPTATSTVTAPTVTPTATPQVRTISGVGLQNLVRQDAKYVAGQLHMGQETVVKYTDGADASPQNPEIRRIEWVAGKAVAYVDFGSGAKPVALSKVTQDNYNALAQMAN